MQVILMSMDTHAFTHVHMLTQSCAHMHAQCITYPGWGTPFPKNSKISTGMHGTYIYIYISIYGIEIFHSLLWLFQII